MVVHHVEVDPVGTGGNDVAHLLAQAGEIGREDGGGNAVGFSHTAIFAGRMPDYIWPSIRFLSKSSHATSPSNRLRTRAFTSSPTPSASPTPATSRPN